MGITQVAMSSHVGRTVTIIDVRHCSIKAPRTEADIGHTVKLGEAEKERFYAKNFKLPEGVKVVPFVVDAYGKWGEQGKKWLEEMCTRAANENVHVYNRLISSARETISLAHARGVGHTICRCVEHCFNPEDYSRACLRQS